MKGDEARVVFFLHPVDQLKDGQVSRVKQLSWSSSGVCLLLLLSLLLGLGVLMYILLQFGGLTQSQPGLVSTTEVSSDATTESPERTTEDTSNQKRRNDSTAQIDALKETPLPGIICTINLFLVQIQMKSLSYSNTTCHLICHFAEAKVLETSTTWLLYSLVASSSLLLAYLTFLIMKWGYLRSELVKGWMRRLTGKSPKEEKMLLHTLPYYLAITRSSCEVRCFIFLDLKIQFTGVYSQPSDRPQNIQCGQRRREAQRH